METSVSVQNDAILKKAKRWIISSLIGALITQIASWIFFNYLITSVELFYNNLYNSIEIFGRIDYCIQILWSIFFIIGSSLLLKHGITSVRFFGKMLIVYQSIVLLSIITPPFLRSVLCKVYDNIWIREAWSSIIFRGLIIIYSFLFLMGLAALWKDRQIKMHYSTTLSLFIMITFLTCVLMMPSHLWELKGCLENPMIENYESLSKIIDIKIANMLGKGLYIPQIIGFIVQILKITCFYKLLKTPSLMPTENATDEIPYSYRPTKIEIGFVVCVALFIGTIFLTFLIV